MWAAYGGFTARIPWSRAPAVIEEVPVRTLSGSEQTQEEAAPPQDGAGRYPAHPEDPDGVGPAVYGFVETGGAGIGGAVVTLTGADGRAGRAVTDPDGGFEFHLPAGGAYVLAVAAGGAAPVTERVVVADVPVRRDVALDPTAGTGQLRGTVTAAGRGGGVAAVATLVGEDGRVAATAATHDDGRFLFAGLPAGRYTLTAAGYPPQVRVVRLPAGGDADVRIALGDPAPAGG